MPELLIHNAVEVLTARAERPWLILGKGPTLERMNASHLLDFYTLSLNHACINRSPTAAHFTDLSAYLDCAHALLSSLVILPWIPHVGMAPGKFTLAQLCQAHPDLKLAAERGHLLSYNSTRVPAQRHAGHLPVIRVRYFSAVPAFNLLVAAGKKEIYTLGVDGGTGYARGLDHKDRLANGQRSFDIQFQEIRHTCRQHGVRHIDLGKT